MKRSALFGAAMLLASSTQAFAHEPYLLPNFFDATNRPHVTVEGSFTEKFFNSDIQMKSDDYHAIDPDGAKVALTPLYLKDVTLIEVPTAKAGTYRITTGLRAGRIAKARIGTDDQGKETWIFLDPSSPPPQGVKAFDMQSMSISDVYVSKGKPNDIALKPDAKGLQFIPITHPSSIFVDQDAVFELRFNAKPEKNQTILLHQGDEKYADTATVKEIVTDARGRVTLRLPHAGPYTMVSRHRVAPTKADAVGRSYTASITFEADK